jgi:phosphopantetheinyl transferase
MVTLGYHYRYAPLNQLALPVAVSWLSSREQADMARIRDSRRREAWLAGRIVVKQLLAERLTHQPSEGVSLAELEIVSRDAAGRKIRPQACLAGRQLCWTLSISHSDRAVLAAVAPAGVAVGVDLAPSEQRLGRGFWELWFSPEERRWLNDQKCQSVLAAWAVKEAAYKALNRGEPFEPRGWKVEPCASGGWNCWPIEPRAAADCRITIWRTPCQELAALAAYTEPTSIHRLETAHD